MQDLFDRFCVEYNLDYDLTRNGNTQYMNKETQKAFICFKYGHNFRVAGKWSDPL